MKVEDFISGTWRQQYQYKSFLPTLVNQPWNWDDPTINVLLEQATKALGELNAFSLIVPDVDLFLKMHVLKEAQTSSRIEGTQTGIDEVLLPEEQIEPSRRGDWREVHNYIDAMNDAVDALVSLPLSNRLLRQTHTTLMRGVRGEHKQPGEFRTSQNWIGGSNISDAVFIPPHHTDLPDLMSDLEAFWHNSAITVPHLIRIAISHYQFETIHPFLDGNGRIGRLLITLYLISHGFLAKPSLYLSDFFERNRTNYYDALMRARTANDLQHWIRFFLNGVAETAAKARDTFQQILQLRTEVEQKIMGLGARSVNAQRMLHVLYRYPVIRASAIEQELELSQPTVGGLLRKFQDLGILEELTGGMRYRLYAFREYIRLF
ncbi:MAG: Fic family protein [Chlorobi bacterium]|nr:MAG: Adenosine monophosphate-protein transferase SoFic [Chlorobi bacterium OLB7]MBK8910414.1 Fic family protein [Chlorobiota bacterium]MBX7217013.1 Fic family protein [Candidatus Kapabacteria bacterium]